MKPEYVEWIAAFKAHKNGALLGECLRACTEMAKAFPELTEVRGHVYCAWGYRGHVWMVTAEGEIVDPTREQFPGPVMHQKWEPGDEVLAGSCMDCGEEIWEAVQSLAEEPPHKTFCSDRCRRRTEAYLNGFTL